MYVGDDKANQLFSHNLRVGHCNRNGQINGFKRFILLTRNPFDAIWSEYRRTVTTHIITRDAFDFAAFADVAVSKLSRK